MKCPRCEFENPDRARFCGRCGARLGLRCPSCGTPNPAEFTFCSACGSPLGTGPAAPAIEERKIVTIVFADVTGSTPLGERLDPEQTRAIIGRFFETMAAVITRHGGTVEKFIGDEVMAVFGLPAAHEDDPERAVRAALAMHEALARLNEARPAPGGPPLQMRVGINTGEVIANPHAVEKGDFMVTGDAVNVAARLRAAAEPGETIVGERTHRQTEWTAEYEPRGPLALKGKADPVSAWRLRGLRAEPSRPRGLRAPLVGRDSELALLEGVLHRVQHERRPHLVTILGLPGVGKSRLLDELTAAHPEFTLRLGRSVPFGGAPMWAVAEILRADSGILRSDTPAEAAAKLEARLAALFPGEERAAERASVLAQLARVLAFGTQQDLPVGEDPRDELFWALRRFFETLAGGPLLLAFEDAHSGDADLLDLVEYLVTATGPILIACLARPDLLERRATWGGGKRNYTSLFLEPLPEADVDALVAGLLPGGSVPPAVPAAVSVAGGNPLFVEEILRMLVDRGALVRRDDRWEMAGAPGGLIPDSVQGVITARLDQLGREEKSTALDAAVLGKDWWMGALEAIGGRTGAALDPVLAALAAKDFVAERGTSRLAGQREFTFKHMLMRDVAYAMLPKAVRAEKHRAFGAWLETTLGERADEFADLLAHHWLQATSLAGEIGRPADESTRKAMQYALRAGRKAALVYANEQALGHFRTAQGLADAMGADEERVAAIQGQADVLALQARWEEASRLYQEALDYHLRRGDVVEQAKVQSRMGSTFSGIFDFRQALPHIQSAVSKLRGRADEPELANAYVQLARTQTYLGQLADAERTAAAGLDVAERLGLRGAAAEAHGIIGWAKMLLGEPVPPTYDEAYLHVVEELADLRRSVSARMGRGFRRRAHGDYAGSEEDVRQALAYAQQAGMRPRMALCLFTLGDLALVQGRWREAAGLYQRYLEEYGDVTSWLEHVRSALAFTAGEMSAAVMWAGRAISRGELRRDAVTHGLAIDWYAMLCLWANRPSDALAQADSGIAYFAPLRVFWPAYFHPVAAEAAVRLGRIEDAAAHCREAEGLAWMDLRPAGARLARARGLVAAAEARWPEAVASLQAAAEAYRALNQPYDQARTLQALGRILRSRDGPGDAARAEVAEAEANGVYARLGAPLLLQESQIPG